MASPFIGIFWFMESTIGWLPTMQIFGITVALVCVFFISAWLIVF